MSEQVIDAHGDPSVWATLREAVRGSHLDYTTAPIGRAVILLAVPMVLEMLMESVFAVADIFFVGRLGADAVATVGITESLMTIIYALAVGLSVGAAATSRAESASAILTARHAQQPSLFCSPSASARSSALRASCSVPNCFTSWVRATTWSGPVRRSRG